MAGQGNHTLAGFQKEKSLLLKGSLDSDGRTLRRYLDSDRSLVAVVVNAIDDALSSKATTALGPWRLRDLGSGLLEQLRFAARRRWTVVVTADHGHTPYIGPKGKVGARGDGQRFSRQPLPESVRFEGPSIPGGVLHLLTRVGAWQGPQRQGFHGGAGLEEVWVPLVLLGQPEPGAGGLSPSSWWTEPVFSPPPEPQPVQELPRPLPLAKPATVPLQEYCETGTSVEQGPRLQRALRQALQGKPRAVQALELLARYQVLNDEQLGRQLEMRAFYVRGLMSQTGRLLAQARLEVPFSVDERGNGLYYRWKPGITPAAD